MTQFHFTRNIDAINLGAHKTRHQTGGADEISLTALSGDPADTINESLLTTQNDIIVRGASIAERLNIGASRIVARLASGNVVAATAAQILNMLGYVHPLLNTYVSETGTAGVDGTAQDVKTVVIPANTLTQVNDRLRIRSYWKGDTGGGITGMTKLNTVTVAEATDGGGADFFTTEAWVHYIDNTHANIIETGAYPATGQHSAENVAGFDWASAQNVVVSQNNVANNHIIVYCIFLDVFPKGVY